MWKIFYEASAEKFLKNVDKAAKVRILKYLQKITNNPKSFGKALTGDKIGLWRYRVGDYRIICRIRDKELVVLVLDIGHRKDIYKK